MEVMMAGWRDVRMVAKTDNIMTLKVAWILLSL